MTAGMNAKEWLPLKLRRLRRVRALVPCRVTSSALPDPVRPGPYGNIYGFKQFLPRKPSQAPRVMFFWPFRHLRSKS